MWPFKKKEEVIIEKEGLQKKFVIGEQIPWKGIFFSIYKVSKEEIILIPERLTMKYIKNINKNDSHI